MGSSGHQTIHFLLKFQKHLQEVFRVEGVGFLPEGGVGVTGGEVGKHQRPGWQLKPGHTRVANWGRDCNIALSPLSFILSSTEMLGRCRLPVLCSSPVGAMSANLATGWERYNTERRRTCVSRGAWPG